ncbi:hypothetical protein COU56_03135 [Candidatus Pacearchaeota archaeon CG10_big_fil_rev_8_21_14_0_10_31_9]|nr:MAG: hypothetical protein AUJ62_01170 [Candidatus Pacearchaeota archaeon CG1_02_32_21]PIN94196.1 MAG: hypothetical protein COU56_03135 [Candidatus Pacearchaeota archaeon CG10_big_fil_rev_8_21_14_0_10_31_9]PIZ82609.1 MAG: hypothetical protein COX97_03930 [Candidatus Pacearchaeota archaeon CG_4_10_14_0_2_um_filter_05_32_18]
MTLLCTKREIIYTSEEPEQRLDIRSQGVLVIYYINGKPVPERDFENETGISVKSDIFPYIEFCIDSVFFSKNGHLKEKLIDLESRLPKRIWAKAVHGYYSSGGFKRELRIGLGSFLTENQQPEQYYEFG